MTLPVSKWHEIPGEKRENDGTIGGQRWTDGGGEKAAEKDNGGRSKEKKNRLPSSGVKFENAKERVGRCSAAFPAT